MRSVSGIFYLFKQRGRILSIMRCCGQHGFSEDVYTDLLHSRMTDQRKQTEQRKTIGTHCVSLSPVVAERLDNFKNFINKNHLSLSASHSQKWRVQQFSSDSDHTGVDQQGFSSPSVQEQKTFQNTNQSKQDANKNDYISDSQNRIESPASVETLQDTVIVDNDIKLLQSGHNVLPPSEHSPYDYDSKLDAPVRELQDLEDLSLPKPMKPSYNLAPYLAQSDVLQRLVALGVDLSEVEKIIDAADFIVQADWDTDIQPKLLFLHDVGVEDAQLGHVLTKNPLLLKESIENMQIPINYLQSKKFSKDGIRRIVTLAPLTPLLPATFIDRKLGFLQEKFHLTGNEVRLVSIKLPKIIPWKLQKLKDLHFYVKEFLGFSDVEQKSMLLVAPKVYLSDKHQLGKRFDFLYNTMGLTHKHLVLWPSVFRTRLHILQQRHRFLLLMGRAQYDPTKENYVSLKALVSGKDDDFCTNVAKASTSQFYDFLKTL